MLRLLPLLSVAGLLAAPIAAQAEIARAPLAAWSAGMLVQKPAGLVAGVPAQRIVLRPMNFAGRPAKIAAVPVKDSWTNDEGFRIDKGRLAFRHRF